MGFTDSQTLGFLLVLGAVSFGAYGLSALLARLCEMRDARRELRKRALERLATPPHVPVYISFRKH